jgi:hypothetical protein
MNIRCYICFRSIYWIELFIVRVSTKTIRYKKYFNDILHMKSTKE